MRILVYDIAAKEGGGGASILNLYFQNAVKDTENEWWFIVSISRYDDVHYDHIHVIKESFKGHSAAADYAHRLWFEATRLRKLIKEINPDEVISLQNMPVPFAKCKQTVYLHHMLSFAPAKFHFTKKDERSLAFRQYIICRLIRMNIHKADEVIVQTEWMKKSLIDLTGYPENQIKLQKPLISCPVYEGRIEKEKNSFIYPASPYVYKNHDVILRACEILLDRGINNFKVEFTIKPEDNETAKHISSAVQQKKLPVEMIGQIDQKTLFKKYKAEILLFPSCVETFGLPMLEARLSEGYIIASDCPFSHEILDGYDGAEFVRWDDPAGWAEAMAKQIEI